MKQASGQILRPQCRQDWDDQRLTIEELYWAEDRDLTEVVKVMRDVFGFLATGKQYQSNLKRWGLYAHVKAGEMKAKAQVRKRRRAYMKEGHSTLRSRPAMTRKNKWFLKSQGASSLSSHFVVPATASTPSPRDHKAFEVVQRSSPTPIDRPLTPSENTSLASSLASDITYQDEPLATNHWAGLLVSSLHELTTVYDRLHAPAQPLPSLLEVINFEDLHVGSHCEPTALFTQTMQHVAG